MSSQVEILAGACGFRTKVCAISEDGQHVVLEIETDCQNIAKLARQLQAHGPLDAFAELDPRQVSPILAGAASALDDCCAGCIVPSGISKCLQVAAGLQLPTDAAIRFLTDG